MADILVTSPFQPFTLPTQFKAVFNGYIYCGTVDAVDPSVSQVQVYLVNESGDKVPVTQPLRTNAGGFLVYNGQPAKFVTSSNHSLLVRDSLGSQLWYAPNMAEIDPAAASFLAIEALRRSYAEAGYNLVAGSFEAGGTLVNANDVLLQERTGKAFTGPAGPVAAGTDPASGGFVDVSSFLLRSNTIICKSSIPEMISAIDIKSGDVVSTGHTTWKINTNGGLALSNGLFATPYSHVHLEDYGLATGEDVSSILTQLWSLGFWIHSDSKFHAHDVVVPDTFCVLEGSGELSSGSSSRVLYQSQMAETSMTLQSDINRGNTTCVLSDPNIPIGAIVRLVSNDHISKKWTASVVRPYYNEGEINKVIGKSGNTYTFETEFFFDYRIANMKSASWYVPRTGVRLQTVLSCDPSSVYNGNTGLELWQQDNNVELDIKTRGFNSNGVLLGQCWKPNVERVDAIGGDDASGKNYGLDLADGTRFAAVKLVRGNDTRHSIAVGGSGRAIPLQGSVTKAFNTNTNKTSVALPGIDMHGNSGGFIFGECITDTTVTIAGVNNHIESAQCGDGWFTIAGDDGGFNCSIGTLKMTNPYRVTNAAFPSLNLHIEHLNIEYSKVVADTQLNLNQNGTTSIGRLFVKNRGVDEATSDADAINKMQPVPWSFRADTDVDSAEISGFSYVRFVGSNITVGKLTIDNCGWTGSVPTAQTAIYFQTSMSNVLIKQILTKASNSALTYSNRLLGFSPDSISNLTIQNVSGSSSRPRVIDAPATVSGLRLMNNVLSGISSNSSAGARIWAWNGLADA